MTKRPRKQTISPHERKPGYGRCSNTASPRWIEFKLGNMETGGVSDASGKLNPQITCSGHVVTRDAGGKKNQATYERNRSNFPIDKIIEQGATNLQSIVRNAEPDTKVQRAMKEALTVLQILAARSKRLRHSTEDGQEESENAGQIRAPNNPELGDVPVEIQSCLLVDEGLSTA
ncbi:hypothetical protein R1sor_014553 [Riccia sorocarpa]|uniref:Ribosomal protein S3 n=1 Tax=Riccia sorocarpa TaxID=122646 RepID=A0ABD3HCK1_9MARC